MKKIIFTTILLLTAIQQMKSQWFLEMNSTGNSWTYDLDFTSSDTGYAVGLYGARKTVNGASSWSSMSLGSPYLNAGIYNKVTFQTQSQGCIIGNTYLPDEAKILMTYNGGLNWNATQVGNLFSVPTDVCFPDSQTGYVVGANGEIYKSNNFGNTWASIPSPTARNLYAVFFTDPLHGFIGGDTALYKTTDGGNSWTSLSGNQTQVFCIYFTSPLIGYIIDDGSMFKTTDGGNNWLMISPNMGLISDIYFLNNDTGWAITSISSGIYKTINGGNYWSLEIADTVNTNSPLSCVNFVNDTVGYISGGNGFVLKTTNGGGSSYFPMNDASPDSLVVPVCTGIQSINITINNPGINTLTSTNINWWVDGIQQVPYNWTGVVPSNGISAMTNIGTYNFSIGTHTITIVTSNPNGNSDDRPQNDSLIVICTAGACSFNDCGINTIVNPAGFLGSPGLFNVDLKIHNYGYNTVTSVEVHWSVNNILQPSFLWTGTIPTNANTGSISIGQYNFQPGTNHIKAWTTNPNNSIDNYNTNDSIDYSVFICNGQMVGTYTIQGSSSNFNSFKTAVDALVSCGVGGPVVFNITPGTYNEQITIPAINGASSLNTITFQSINGDSTSVILTYGKNSSNYDLNFTLNLSGAAYFTFRKITIASTDTTYYSVVKIYNNSSHNTFEFCRVTGIPDSLISGPNGTLFDEQTSTSTLEDDNAYLHNHLYNAYAGIMLRGALSLLPSHNRVEGNLIEVCHWGIFSLTQDSVVISGNTIRISSQDVPTNPNDKSFGINVTGPSYASGFNITNNKIDMPNGGYRVGIYHSGPQSSYGTLIANNFIRVNSLTTAWSYGIYSNNSRARIFNNSIQLTGAYNINTICVYLFQNQYQSQLLNNIISSQINATSISSSSTNFTSDYNDIYPFYISGYSNLNTWQLTGNDLHSLSVPAPFISVTDLHLQSWNNQLDGMGTPIGVVPFDIDSETRDLVSPDIGADEYLPSVILNSAGVYEITLHCYPIPTNSILYFSGIDQKSTANIYNLSGQLLGSFSLIGPLDKIDLTYLPAGIYFVNIYGESQYRYFDTIRIVKQ